jgi:predicted nucleotidyltransferase
LSGDSLDSIKSWCYCFSEFIIFYIFMIYPKDFIETAEGLLFAVVNSGLEQGKALCFLRYVQEGGCWRKQATEDANAFLRRHHSHYLHYSLVLDAGLHAVSVERIVKHYQPRLRLKQLMENGRHDPVERDVVVLGELLKQQGVDLERVGVTGSVLVGVQNEKSDIDLVCYGRDVFHHCRAIVRALIEQNRLQDLADSHWQESYSRRNCSLGYEDYVWHEKRKCNKALVNGRKFDLSLIEQEDSSSGEDRYQKLEPVTLICRITDDTCAFDYPSVYRIDHGSIARIVCFTATYAGQACNGELVEVSGMLEQNAEGIRQIVVGSSREAHGEHIRVIDA